MKYMKHLKDFELEKMRLRILQLEQEAAIRQQWKDLKAALKPATLLHNKLAEFSDRKDADEHPVSGLLNVGISYLSHKLGEAAGEKIASTLEQGIDKLAGKVEHVFGRSHS